MIFDRAGVKSSPFSFYLFKLLMVKRIPLPVPFCFSICGIILDNCKARLK